LADRGVLAPAKVNLFLHVGPAGGDGYHPLASLVAFADIGDRLWIAPSERLSLTVQGPFAQALREDASDNLVLRAVRALGRRAGIGDPAVALTLDKQLPIAAGLGGGSSDAGAALRLTRDALGLNMDDPTLAEIAGQIGADGPMCLHGRAAWAEGRGDRLSPEPRLPPLPAVMINPGVASPTGAVYRAYDAGPARQADRPPPPEWTVGAVIDWLARQRNDLEPPALSQTPAIGEALGIARGLAGARLARMSGSGATVFALFETAAEAEAAARTAQEKREEWWVRQVSLS
jgi:4-diphosphocytidyl-2-C-methyl-D-erythritol kinase